jgi:hypothetical protein
VNKSKKILIFQKTGGNIRMWIGIVLMPDPNLDRHQTGNPDPGLRQHKADPQHWF